MRVLKLARTVHSRFQPAEADAIDEMKRRTGCTTDENLILAALWRFSEHLDMRLPLRARLFEERLGAKE